MILNLQTQLNSYIVVTCRGMVAKKLGVQRRSDHLLPTFAAQHVDSPTFDTAESERYGMDRVLRKSRIIIYDSIFGIEKCWLHIGLNDFITSRKGKYRIICIVCSFPKMAAKKDLSSLKYVNMSALASSSLT